MRFGITGACLLAFGAIGCPSETHQAGVPASDAGDAQAAPPAGWSLRDDTPYPRTRHAMIVDETEDRLIVFGGAGNDTWQLPLSGPNAHRWAELHVEGPRPLTHADARNNSAVYDRNGNRLFVLLDENWYREQSPNASPLWELSLDGTPAWAPIVPSGEGAPASLSRGSLALDAANRRVFIVADGVWSMSLDAPPIWTLWAGLPNGSSLHDNSAVAIDPVSRRLVVCDVSSSTGVDEVWALSLDTATWSKVGDQQPTSGAVNVLDVEGDRLVSFAGDGWGHVTQLSLTSGVWTSYPRYVRTGSGLRGVLDAKRGRILYFGGGSNAVLAVDLDTLTWDKLVPATPFDALDGTANMVWDPVRARVVAFGDSARSTRVRGLKSSGEWASVPAGLAPVTTGSAPVYDPVSEAIVSFGDYSGSANVARWRSVEGASWNILEAGPGPAARFGNSGVYDAAHGRVVFYGAVRLDDQEHFDDAWALVVDGSPHWEPLDPTGTRPAARRDHVAIYDPQGPRMIVYGGTAPNGVHTDLWALSLDHPPSWTKLDAAGTGPGQLHNGASAVYDEEHRRMVVCDFSEVGPARVFALELEEGLVWHEFCATGSTPSWTVDVTNSKAVLVPDGLFVSVGAAAFRFSLDTGYCDAASNDG